MGQVIPFAFWKKNLPSGWTWIAGYSVQEKQGHHGTQGTGNTGNWPGARGQAFTWKDSSGIFWLFGGQGYEQGDSGWPTAACLSDLWKYNPANGQWTWVKGSSGRYESPTYGTMGTAAAGNTPGCRYDGSAWIDASNNLWLFGGLSNQGYYNDLWKFDTTTSNWTWVSGTNSYNQAGAYGTLGTGSTSNYPGGRSLSAKGNWVGSDGNLWLIGGDGYDTNGNFGPMNDLWRFEPANNKWTWMAGSKTNSPNAVYGTQGTGSTSNTPGGRHNASVWADAAGFLWLFGGETRNATGTLGFGNDVWKFEIATKKWTWVKGYNGINQGGTYGTQGTAAAGNTPGGRQTQFSAVDSSGNFWMIGGNGLDSTAQFGYMNDVWKYDPTANQWTWIAGSKLRDQVDSLSGTYGTLGVGSTSNLMGARDTSSMWLDSSGVIWLYGGWGFADRSSTSQGYVRDLWKFNPSNLQWTWVSGLSYITSEPIFGTKGTEAPTNNPGARMQQGFTIDSSGNIWQFGGVGPSIYDNEDVFNTFWKYNPTTGQWTWMTGSNQGGPAGIYGTQGTANAANTPGARYGTQMVYDSVGGNIWLFGGTGLDINGSWGMLADLWKYNIASGQWTWVAGPNIVEQSGVYGTKGTANAANYPGGRDTFAIAVDPSSNIWIFGGWGKDSTGTSGQINDMWKFNGSQWTWMAGGNLISQSGTYGTIKTAAAANTPGSRQNINMMSDSSGNIWLFGGLGYDKNGQNGLLNDVWKFNGSQWAWMGGSSTTNGSGAYGTQGVGSTSNKPGGRDGAGMVIDSNGKIWVFGGRGRDNVGSLEALNDLWKFDPSNDQWTWVTGSNTIKASGVYGTKGVLSTSSVPGAREQSRMTIDSSNNLYLLDGIGFDSVGTKGYMNEIWKYKP